MSELATGQFSLYEIISPGIITVDIVAWNEYVKSSGLANTTWWEYYMNDHIQPPRETKERNNVISYVLTEMLRDTIDLGFIKNHDHAPNKIDIKRILEEIDYNNFRIFYNEMNTPNPCSALTDNRTHKTASLHSDQRIRINPDHKMLTNGPDLTQPLIHLSNLLTAITNRWL